MSNPKIYIGDGAYVAYDGFNFILTTENGISVTNEIVLEPQVLASFNMFVRDIQAAQLPQVKVECECGAEFETPKFQGANVACPRCGEKHYIPEGK